MKNTTLGFWRRAFLRPLFRGADMSIYVIILWTWCSQV